MNRLLAKTLTVLGATGAAIAIAACGGSDKPSDSLDNALQYLPSDAPFVAAVGTDLEGSQAKALGDIVQKFPFGDAASRADQEADRGAGRRLRHPQEPARQRVRRRLDKRQGLHRQRRGRGVGRRDRGKGRRQARGRGQEGGQGGRREGRRQDLPQRRQLGRRTGRHARGRGEQEAARGGDRAPRRRRQLHQGRLREGHRLASARMRSCAPTSTSASCSPATPTRATRARSSGSPRSTGFGLGATATSDSIDVAFNLSTKSGLTDNDLPLAAGSASPEVIQRPGAIGVGVKSPGQIVSFAEAAGKAINPAGFSQYEAGKQQIEKSTGVEPRGRHPRPAEGRPRRELRAERQVRRARRPDGPGRDEEDARRPRQGAARDRQGRDRRDDRLRQAEAGREAPFYALATPGRRQRRLRRDRRHPRRRERSEDRRVDREGSGVAVSRARRARSR